MSILPRPDLEGLLPPKHGGINHAELEMLGISPEEVLDFSANLNPFGPPPSVRGVLGKVDIAQYPDTEVTHLRRVLSQKLGVGVENIMVGNGTTQLIHLAALAYLGRGKRALLIEPSFSEYKIACQISGASIISHRLLRRNNFRLNIEDTIRLIGHRPKVIFIGNPNNPTGQYLARAELEKLLSSSQDSLVVLDEAYLSFVDKPWGSSLEMTRRHNLFVLRSMTKDYALAGLRLGYGVAREEIIATLGRICPPWSVNALAQEAGIAALKEEGYLKRCQAELKRAKNFLLTELSRLGLEPVPSNANFFLVEVGNATDFRQRLLKRKILVRDCTSFGLPCYIRIAPRTLPECQRLIAAAKEVLSEGAIDSRRNRG